MAALVTGHILAQLGAAAVSLGVLLVPAVAIGIAFAIAWRRLTR